MFREDQNRESSLTENLLWIRDWFMSSNLFRHQHVRDSSKLKRIALLTIAVASAFLVALLWFTSPTVHAQSSTLGSPLPGLTSDQTTLFNNGLKTFDTKWDALDRKSVV